MKKINKSSIFILLLSVNINFLFSQIRWQNFNAQTFEISRKQNKPILLHLAANWCHWCHVMDDKTYNNPRIIKYINKNYIACIEDHDLRPDLANKYREYGWPATIIYSPDGKELFKHAGYIDADQFIEILKIYKSYNASSNIISEMHKSKPIDPTFNNIPFIYKDVINSMDLIKGGFQSEQKSIDFDLFEFAFMNSKNDTFKIWLDNTIRNSLNLMDTIWGGVYQYSTFKDWNHPHYEKLLSIQARYIKIYLWYFYLSGDSVYLNASKKIYEYCKRFLYSNEFKAFYNAQDADLIKGKKANDYFALSDEERLNLGIPAVDININTEKNSRMCESLLLLFSSTKDSSFFYEAQNALQFILQNRKKGNLFLHSTDTIGSLALVDQIYLAHALLKFYYITLDTTYYENLLSLLNEIKIQFFNGQCFNSFIPQKNFLQPDCLVSENIMAGRLFNIAGKLFKNTEWESMAKNTLYFLCSDNVYDKIVTEAGILTSFSEIMEEPLSIILLNYDENKYDSNELFFEIQKLPLNYFSFEKYDRSYIPKEKNDVIKGFNEISDNFVLVCTSSFCSSPLFSANELKKFILSYIQNKNQF